jgi:hypothetical protein
MYSITLKTAAKTASALGVAVALVAGSLAPALAASKAQRARLAPPTQAYSEPAYAAARSEYGMSAVPYAFASPYTCVIDDGYGRWSSCDSGE